MSTVTVFFVVVIAISMTCTFLFNSLAAKLGRLEITQKELEAQLQKEFDLRKQASISEVQKADISEEQKADIPEGQKADIKEDLKNAVSAVETAKQSYDAALAKYNESIVRFPGILVAGIFGFKVIPNGDEVVI